MLMVRLSISSLILNSLPPTSSMENGSKDRTNGARTQTIKRPFSTARLTKESKATSTTVTGLVNLSEMFNVGMI